MSRLRCSEWMGAQITQWPEHWTNGGTGLAKFPPEDRRFYETAIKESGRTDLFLKDNELHSNTRDSKSDFWRVFRRLKYGDENIN